MTLFDDLGVSGVSEASKWAFLESLKNLVP